MKYRWEITAVLVLTLLLVFLYIQHRNSLIHLSYRKQKDENELAKLGREKEKAANAFLEAQRHDSIKIRAQKELGMQATAVKQMRTLTPRGV
ncbi:TPA: hypothetical protein DDZ86_00410 [Candidatus Dependentiae bacterium]|nr:MAG: hypothetical protein UW09_C0002G0040 [candidate division TM6 bacterium GW2011_GWF2_43_87]HBL98091.1 hypothetical protein [Candidatus Dependentiae bacterium]